MLHGIQGKTLASMIALFFASVGPLGCGSGSGAAGQSGSVSGMTAASVGGTCQGGDGKVCLGVKVVSYVDGSGNAAVSREQAASNIQQINQVWAQCNLGFQVEEYAAINPADFGLQYSTADYVELDQIRKTLSDDRTLLIVTTGPWNRNGGLGGTGANAWTAMPTAAPYGAVLESSVGTFGNIIAHELGHYLNLDHVSDTSDLMNPVIYDQSTHLSASQCEAARNAASQYWASAER